MPHLPKTPLMQQHAHLKEQYPGALLLFRVGDFYEAFGEDAKTLSHVLDIVLTKRSNGGAAAVPLAGFPHHAIDTYIPKLVRAGLRVAICDQLEHPKHAKGLVKRGVTELVTPGVAYHDHVLEKKRNNYLASLHFAGKQVGLALLDLSTGEFLADQGEKSYIENLLHSLAPAEVITSKEEKQQLATLTGDRYHLHYLDPWVYQQTYAYEKLTHHFGTTTLKGFGIEAQHAAITAAGAILHYLSQMEQRNLAHITHITRIAKERYVMLDKFTIRNLELLQPQHEEGIALIDILDKNVTPMGTRLLRKWLLMPLKELAAIEERQNIVHHLVQDLPLTTQLHSHLAQLGDLERLISKVAARRINPREMLALCKALQHTHPIQEALQQSHTPPLQALGKQLHPCHDLLQKIATTLQPHPPIVTHQGGIIQTGVDPHLDELHKLVFEGKDYLHKLQLRERKTTGIGSLKVGYNKIFGYYLEVTHAHKAKVPTTWVRKQTLVNAERYITEELKGYEEKILHAKERIIALEQVLYSNLVEEAAKQVVPIQHNSRLLATIDCYHAFATVATKHDYVRPLLDESHTLQLTAARHPVIEQHLPLGKMYVPNDIHLDTTTHQIHLITGPNMAGKSACLRMVALNVILAQIGSFIPAKKGHIGVLDKVFTRVGASDNIAKQESTFMVEMNETANILHHLTPRSLVILDELGRGTSTTDGIALAQAIIEYLHTQAQHRAKALFSTHYHCLNTLASQLPRMHNYHMGVRNLKGKILFLYTLQPGGTSHSFGIQVAKAAGTPPWIIDRAQQLLEQASQKEPVPPSPKQAEKASTPPILPKPLEELVSTLQAVDTNTMTPVAALLKLAALQELLHSLSIPS